MRDYFCFIIGMLVFKSKSYINSILDEELLMDFFIRRDCRVEREGSVYIYLNSEDFEREMIFD